MWRKQLVKLRILVIEDYKRQRKTIIKDIEDIFPSTSQKFSISDFQVDEADCLEEGLARLKMAVSLSLPYHLVLLDLGIPLTPRVSMSDHDSSDESETENGFEILKFISEKPSFKITEQSLKNLKSEGIPDEILEKLQDIKNQEIASREWFLDQLNSKIGREQDVKLKWLIMKHATEKGGAMGVIIISAFKEHGFVRRGFQSGAVDFIAKPFNTDNLQTQTLNAWMRILRKESDRILQQRIKDLIPHLKNGLAHYFTTVFSKLMLSVSDRSDKIEGYAKERYGLDPNQDAENPLMQNLRLQKEALTEARIAWKNQQGVLGVGDNLPQTRRVEAMLRHLNRSLLPCLTVKRTNLNIQIPAHSNTSVITFQNDAHAILREIILGGINDLPDLEKVTNFTITIEPAEGTHAVVRFVDDLKPISKGAADAINRGTGIIQGQSLGREWGLSIAQHIALRGGGHLEVRPQKGMGNIITCKIQKAHYA